MKLIGQLEGFEFIGHPGMVMARQVRFPRSKRRRIIRKWALRKENNEFTPCQHVQVYYERKIVVAHPDVVEKLKGLLKAYIEEREAGKLIDLIRKEGEAAELEATAEHSTSNIER